MKKLLSIFLENINEFNLENFLVSAVNIYNKTIYRITKYTPNEIFYNSNEDFFKLIENNILDNYNKTNKTELIFKEIEKMIAEEKMSIACPVPGPILGKY